MTKRSSRHAFIYVGRCWLSSHFRNIMELLGFENIRHKSSSMIRMCPPYSVEISTEQPQGLSSSIRGQMPPEHECIRLRRRPHSRYQGETRSGVPSKESRGHRHTELPLRLTQITTNCKPKLYCYWFRFFNQWTRLSTRTLFRVWQWFIPVRFMSMDSPHPVDMDSIWRERSRSTREICRSRMRS